MADLFAREQERQAAMMMAVSFMLKVRSRCVVVPLAAAATTKVL